MKKRDIAECIIYDVRGRFLLQKKTVDYPTLPGGFWCLFGGEIEKEETPLQAVQREMYEELSYKFNSFKLFRKMHYKLGKDLEGETYIFSALFEEHISKIKLNEGAGIAFFEFQELYSVKTGAWTFNILKTYFLRQQCLRRVKQIQ